LAVENSSDLIDVRIYDVLGRAVYTAEAVGGGIWVDGIDRGFYSLKALGDGWSCGGRLVVE